MSIEDLRSFVAIVVLLVWAASGLTALYTGQFTVLKVTTPVMLTVAGFLFGFQRYQLSVKKKEDGE